MPLFDPPTLGGSSRSVGESPAGPDPRPRASGTTAPATAGPTTWLRPLGRAGRLKEDCGTGNGYSVNLGFDIAWGSRAGDWIAGKALAGRLGLDENSRLTE